MTLVTTLASPLRKKLQDAVESAREEAEAGVRAALTELGVADAEATRGATAEQAALRKLLRARARQLGDKREPSGKHEVERLVTEAAYEHWHRMLFARFLAESQLLMHPDGVPVSLGDCEELASDEGARNGWELAGRYASRMLPQVFRVDSPCLLLPMPAERQRRLEKLVAELPPEVFVASDALGWVYQFWQTRSKKAVNDSGVKIGARELPAVTQLFTEPYMVAFLLDNALGAWWAARRLSAEDLRSAPSEDALRQKASLPGVPLSYLRFVRDEHGVWAPAAGTFDAWPHALSDLKVLDPCCGSGHFLVAVLHMLVPMRMALEGLDAKRAVDRVLSENVFGLELDRRCIELGAFALALNAWRYPAAGGYRALPTLNVACSGLSVGVAKEEWRALGLGKKNLGLALEWLHETFAQAPVLGSLVDPSRKEGVAKTVSWEELSKTLDQALSKEDAGGDAEAHEVAVTAQGLAKAARLMAGKYHWVVTNVPYLARGKQNEVLRQFCEKHYPAAQADLATVFLDRCLEYCGEGGTTSVVIPQNWLFLKSYSKLRARLLDTARWDILAALGSRAFGTISGEVVKVVLSTLTVLPTKLSVFDFVKGDLSYVDCSPHESIASKDQCLRTGFLAAISMSQQATNPDSRISLAPSGESGVTLEKFAKCFQGISTGDVDRFSLLQHETTATAGWPRLHSKPSGFCHYSGCDTLLRPGLTTSPPPGSAIRGKGAWGKSGIVFGQISRIPAGLYWGELFPDSTPVMVVDDPDQLIAIWAWYESGGYVRALRSTNSKNSVNNGYYTKIPFDLDHWTQVAAERYPNGLPKPYSDDPTQWIFHGHPCGSVIWDETLKWTAEGPLRTDASVLQVAVARLLGYRWPAELDPTMELCDESRVWVARAARLSGHADDDGIVCVPSVGGERAAADRLNDLLSDAYEEAWNTTARDALFESIGASRKGLEAWLRDDFFEAHCAMFQHRPFIWQIWDGLKKGGFSALVNYHKLDHKLLETLTYTHLSDWISAQQGAVKRKVDGAEERLAAAIHLHGRLKLILEGEAPYDIFVRWKRLDQEPIGWHPDLNDGVRLNIRPFVKAEVLRHCKKPKLNLHWNKDRGQDVPSAPWYDLGPKKGGNLGDRINDHHLTLAEKQAARAAKKSGG